MSEKKERSSRRDFIKTSGAAVAVTGLLSAGAIPRVHAAQDSTVQIALVGCGGRGTGAADNALATKNGPVKLIAMADVFERKLNSSLENLQKQHKDSPEKIAITPEQKFIGFDGYKKAMDCLSPGDVVILTTPCGFRWVHFAYAIEKGLNVFMEKPLTADAPTTMRMFELNKLAMAKNLKVGVGLMCRHCKARKELFQRIQDGQIGDINLIRAYRQAGPTATAFVKKKPEGISELMYQIDNFHSFLWLSGGAVSDFLIHNIDESCWMKNDWPVEAKASGGRHYRGDYVDQNFDSYSIEYTFGDGAKMFVEGRTMPGCTNEFASYAHGSKGMAVISTSGHSPAKCRIYEGQSENKDKLVWEFPQPEENPYQLEWDDLMDAIRNDKPYNEVDRGLMASIVTSMGRMVAHTGQKMTLEEMMQVDHEFAPEMDMLTLDSDSPLPADADGKYPIPLPGLVKDREYI
jgi:predicted dehydrogenase